MAYIDAFEACRLDLYTDEQKLREKYPVALADKVMRIREMYHFMLSAPSTKDREFIDEDVYRFGVSRPTAASDLGVVRALLPMLGAAAKDFHRWRANEMMLETYAAAKRRNDVRTMSQVAASYAKYNRIDVEDVVEFPHDKIIVQPFVPTDDPRVLGIEPVANLRERQKALLKELAVTTPEIEFVEFEEADVDNIFNNTEGE